MDSDERIGVKPVYEVCTQISGTTEVGLARPMGLLALMSLIEVLMNPATDGPPVLVIRRLPS
jgi:hypothetical protein